MRQKEGKQSIICALILLWNKKKKVADLMSLLSTCIFHLKLKAWIYLGHYGVSMPMSNP